MKSLNPFSTGSATSKTAKTIRAASAGVSMFETLESRTMQSVSPSTAVHADIIRARSPLAGTAVHADIIRARSPLAGVVASTLPVVANVATESVVTKVATESVVANVLMPVIHPPVIILDAIQTKYQALGGTSSFLGQPVGSETATGVNGGILQQYQGGTIFWSMATGAHEVHGLILEKFAQLGGVGVMGYPTTDELSAPNSLGCFNNFSNGGAVYYQNGAAQAFGISGPTYRFWLANGGVLGSTRINGIPGPAQGFPTSDVQEYPNGEISYFQNAKVIYTPQGGTQEVAMTSSMTFNTVYLTTPQAVGGTATLTVREDGSYSFSYNFNNTSWAGIATYTYSVTIGLVSPTGMAYTFTHSNNNLGKSGEASTVNGSDFRLAVGWNDLVGAKMVASASASFNSIEIYQTLSQALNVLGTVAEWASIFFAFA